MLRERRHDGRDEAGAGVRRAENFLECFWPEEQLRRKCCRDLDVPHGQRANKRSAVMAGVDWDAVLVIAHDQKPFSVVTEIHVHRLELRDVDGGVDEPWQQKASARCCGVILPWNTPSGLSSCGGVHLAVYTRPQHRTSSFICLRRPHS